MSAAEYDEKIEWLFGQFPSYQKVGAAAYKTGIDTMLAFAGAMGNPERKIRCIHVAGTNGKGSVSHMMAAGLAACGFRTGLYTSPHIKDFRERIKIIENGSFRMISKESVFDFLCKWENFFVENRPSFFEITTAMALDFFAREKVDIAVIETGLGGRLDSTNIITPLLSIITNIGLEHCEHLGYTLQAIAAEKAGIIKPGVAAVVGEFTKETKPVFESKAESCASPLTFAQEREKNWLSITPADLDLKGDYQQRNLRTLSAAAEALSGIFSFDKSAFEKGICSAAESTGLRGRWETLLSGEGKPTVICDSGHNAHGLRWVAQQIDRISCDYKNVFVVLGLAKEKNADAIAELLPHNVNYIFTNASSARAMSVADLAGTMSDHGIFGRSVIPVSKAYETALSLAGSEDLIVITGSNFVLAEIL